MGDLSQAPPPITVDGLHAVPVRVDQITASFQIDAAAKTASATAEMAFSVGPEDGFPVFDLRQTILAATLDGSLVPPSDIAHHDFGGGANAQMRILERWLTAGTAHVLALTYPLDTPASPNSRGLVWEAGSSRLSFDFFFSDLNPARYLEAWLPSTMLWGTFPVTLDVEMTGAPAHVLISNGSVTPVSTNHWTVAFPATFAPCSHFLLIEATDRITQHSTSTILPGGQPVTIDVATRTSDGINLVAGAAAIAGHLATNTSGTGPYMHGDRYTALLTSPGYHNMEYDGATTTSNSALGHEVFHSWWARGLVPAQGQDGWLDEAWTSYMTGALGAVPLDMGDPPVTMWPGNPWARRTPPNSYSHGASIFSGIAADIGIGVLQSHMANIYQAKEQRHYTTPEIEAALIRRSGHMAIADYFERFVYGGDTAGPGAANLHLRDAPDDTGAEPYSGTFWLSPDVWVRNAEDGGTAPQAPEFGQDNWLYARVRNRGTATARSFVIGFKLQVWAGTEFIYPGDWFPLTGVAVGFELAPGASQVVHTRWPAADIPAKDTHGCLLALAWCLDDRPVSGRHVWEEDTLAQRNMTVVDLQANEWEHLPIRIGSRHRREAALHMLELSRPREAPDLEVRLSHRDPARVKALLRSAERLRAATPPERAIRKLHDPGTVMLGLGGIRLEAATGSWLAFQKGYLQLPGTGGGGARLVEESGGGLSIAFEPGLRAALPIGLDAGQTLGFRLCLRTAKPLQKGGRVDLVQREVTGRAVGGLSLTLGPRDQKEPRR
jgi:hypothetical protein